MQLRFPICFFLSAALLGCAAQSPDAAFTDVQRTVAARLNHRVEWNQNSPDDFAASDAVRTLLQHKLTADEAVQVALLNNRTLQAIYEELGIAQSDLVQAGLLKNPVFTASVRFPEGGAGDPNTEFSVVQEFLDLLVLPLRKKLAAAELEQAKLRVAREVLRLAADVETACYQVQAREQTLAMQRTILEATEASAELAKRQHDAGNIGRLDAVQQRASYHGTLLDVRRGEAALVVEREELARLMGVGDATWQIEPALADMPAADPPVSQLESLAVQQRLELAIARGEVAILATSHDLAKKFRYAGLEVGVDTEHETDGLDVTGPQLSLEIPIFDQKQASIARLASQHRQAQHRLAALELDVRSRVRAAHARLTAARDEAEQFRSHIIPEREEILALSQEQYNGMFIGAAQLLQAKQSVSAAYKDYIDAVRDYWTARAELAHAVGARLPNGVAGVEVIRSPGSTPEKIRGIEDSAPATPSDSKPAADHSHHHH